MPEAGRLALEHLGTGDHSFVRYTRLPEGEHVLDSLPAGPKRAIPGRWFPRRQARFPRGQSLEFPHCAARLRPLAVLHIVRS